MYHIKDDARARQSAALIVEGLFKLLETLGFDRISATALCEAAGVGRSTFYRNFDSVADVLRFEMDRRFLEMRDAIRPAVDLKHPSELQLFQDFLAFWLNRQSLVKLLIRANLYGCFQQELLEFIRGQLAFIPELLHLDERAWTYFSELRVSTLSTALRVAVLRFPEDLPGDVALAIQSLASIQKPLNERPSAAASG